MSSKQLLLTPTGRFPTEPERQDLGALSRKPVQEIHAAQLKLDYAALEARILASQKGKSQAWSLY